MIKKFTNQQNKFQGLILVIFVSVLEVISFASNKHVHHQLLVVLRHKLKVFAVLDMNVVSLEISYKKKTKFYHNFIVNYNYYFFSCALECCKYNNNINSINSNINNTNSDKTSWKERFEKFIKSYFNFLTLLLLRLWN